MDRRQFALNLDNSKPLVKEYSRCLGFVALHQMQRRRGIVVHGIDEDLEVCEFERVTIPTVQVVKSDLNDSLQ